METLTILERPETITWTYDQGADVLYLAIGAPRPAVGVDIGDGLVLQYDETQREVVGLTVIGLRDRLIRSLGDED
jgi:uncharacterized protein YuzE